MAKIKVETLECPECHSKTILEVEALDYAEWLNGGTLIQRAFPYLSDEQRERLLTGYCSPCWDKLFSEE